ncbi:fatty acid synthase-like [Linepithema humile]|uniref:fatty acid synthase-like n=1 Tax=Linepithema humile TaxID=83485 RepID=UPI00351E2E1E
MDSNKKASVIDVESEDDIVISGIAGRFPKSDNIRQLQENLFNKVDLGTDEERRWNHGHPDLPQRMGIIDNCEKFDADYFEIPFNEVHFMDPMSRMLMEHTYEAIVDAGINPKDLSGTNTGIFIGMCFSESEKTWFFEKPQIAGGAAFGCFKPVYANRMSHWLNITGPSCIIDSACSSGLFALESAYRSIRSGQCDAAIVGGLNLCLHPYVALQFARLGILASDGFCKPFTDDANGYMRSETIGVAFLQKANVAKRIYATVVYGKTNCDGYKEQGITFPSSKMQQTLLEEFYKECGISPTSLGYMEAHGTGTYVGDPEEINALEQVFCKNRQTPLLIGSVKSNLGHSEGASSMCQIAKVIIAMETGLIPPNINFTQIRKGVKAFEEGSIRVATNATPWTSGFMGVNSFGFGGANCHILLRSNTKEKINKGAPNDNLPRLVVLSGRTEQAVESFLNEIENRPIDVEYIRLLHDIYADEMKNHPYRGYVIVESKTPIKAAKEIQYYSGEKKPICFVFSGIGSQWVGMGQALLQFPVFSKTIEKCDTILKRHGMYIIDILTSKNKNIFNDILNSLVGITVMQVGLIDLLKSVNIVPDYVVGHSIGELCCAYANGKFILEQVILSSYYIGLGLKEMKKINYTMVNIGLSYENVKNICPPDIEVIYSNSQNTCSISGLKKSVKAFTKQLEASNVFTEEVNCCNIPLHTRYLLSARATILAYLNRIIPQTMTPNHIWQSLFCSAKLSCAEYFTNKLLNPVFFDKTAQLIPRNAVTLEIAPDAILQGVTKELFDTTSITLLQRNHEDNIKVFLQSLGKMYNNGLQPQLANLYPTMKFPVSRSTPIISPSIKWDHSEDWYVTSHKMQTKLSNGERMVEVALNDEDYEYMSGHVIDGRQLLPATGYLILVWETMGMLKSLSYTDMPIVFENVKFIRATHFPKQGPVYLRIMMQKATGKFEIIEGDNAVVTGIVRESTDIAEEKLPSQLLNQENDNEEEVMKTKDIYKELRLRGYQYAGMFRGLKSLSTTGKQGHIAWLYNWVTFMDNMLQIKILARDTRNLHVPTGIQKLVIDTKFHIQQIRNAAANNYQLPVRVYNTCDAVISGGVEIRGIKATSIFRRKPAGEPVLEEYRFIAHRDEAEVSLQEAVMLSTHLALEYHQVIKVNIIELIEDDDKVETDEIASPLFINILGDLPLLQPNITLVTSTDRFDCVTLPSKITVSQSKKLSNDDNAMLITVYNMFTNNKSKTLKKILPALQNNGFLLTREQSFTKDDIATAEKYDLAVVLEKRTQKEHIILLKKREQSTKKIEVILVNNYEFSWLEQLKSILNAKNESRNAAKIILVSEKNSECGLLGLVNCLRREPGGESIRGVFIQDETAPEFSLHEPLYADQLRIDLIINVLRPGKTWGSYRHLPLAPLTPKLVYHAFANQLVSGDLSSFRWIEGAITPHYKENNLVHIAYSSINFKDVMIASGKLVIDSFFLTRGRLEDCMVGIEYVGVDNTGQRVMGIWENRCISNMCISYKYLCWNVPDEWSMEDAATVPCAYGTCCYGLYIKAKMKKGDTILIHSGTGAVGQAAIYLAFHEGCEIFTTVGTPKKRKFIRDTFPFIPENHIGNSRDNSFEQMIFNQTNGRGVDIVLNSLAEEKLQTSIRCLAKSGRFLEIGKFDFMANNLLNLSMLSKGIKFYSVMLDNIFLAPEEMKANFNRIVTANLVNKAIQPIARKVFKQDEVEAAFRYMAAGKHIGKIIIKIHEEGESMNAPILAFPRYYCLSNKSYIILGGLGGFGLELADWLVVRGAQNLVFISRAGVKNGYQQMKIDLWKSYGVKVLIISDVDVSDVKDCEYMLKSAEKLAPVDAIFNLAVVLNDKICPNQTVETFQEPFKAKAWATKNLDHLTRKICPQLRHFVVFSSVSCGRGNAGQTNYGMANSIMERICERRVQEGLHGLAVQWGAIGDVGLVADMQDNDKEMVIGGTLQQKITSCISKLEDFLLQKQPIVASMVVAEKRLITYGASSIIETVANIMNLKDMSTVAHHMPLSELGMDSMMAVEIKQTLEREYEIFLTAQDIRNLNFAKLTKMFDKDVKNEELTEITGMKLLIRISGDDQLIPDVCIKLPTKKSTTESEIFLLPGIEGCGSVFDMLVSKIEGSATCLQHNTYNIGTDCTSIKDITNSLLQHILSREQKLPQNFVLVGYSYGSAIAIELAQKLEEMNLKGQLVLIDGAPEHMKAMANLYYPFTTLDEFQNNVLLGIMDLFQPAVSGKFLLELNKCTNTNWDEKLEIFLKHVSAAYSQVTIDKRKAMCTTMYKHLIGVHEYDVTQVPKIESPIILLKPTTHSLLFPQEDYGLHKITKGKIEIQYVEGTHITIMDNEKVIAAINEAINSIEPIQKHANIIGSNNMTSVQNIYTRT